MVISSFIHTPVMLSFQMYKRGQDNFNTLDFSILPYALRVDMLKRRSARANFSNLSKGVDAVHLEVKVR